jgi:YHS domain-containing protein
MFRNRSHSNTTTEGIDPVCGREVRAGHVEWSTPHGKSVYAFCSKACKETFDADPTGYLLPGGQRRTAA